MIYWFLGKVYKNDRMIVWFLVSAVERLEMYAYIKLTER